MYCGTSRYFLQFRSVHEDVQVFRISLLDFLIPLGKLVARVLFLWNLQSVKLMFGVFMVQGGISGMIVLCISVKFMSTSPSRGQKVL